MASKLFPPAASNQKYVSVHALSSGFLTLPEHLFVHPSPEGTRNTVPSLSFLIQHHHVTSGETTRIVFDLGLRKDLKRYPEELQTHLSTRIPLTTSPDVSDSLKLGGLSPDDIDVVILSHVHWDHVGTPSDFEISQFVVGNGSLDLLRNGGDPSTTGGHSFFEPDLLPLERTTELPKAGQAAEALEEGASGNGPLLKNAKWQEFGPFPNVIDVFSDGSLFIIDSPGHLQGHLNILARLNAEKWIYLAGDACHDRRILRNEVEIATWKSSTGDVCCIHADKAATERTIEMIAKLEHRIDAQIEVILAHDVEWINNIANDRRLWPGVL